MSERKENPELLARRAAALKSNLRKRKEQSGSRSALGQVPETAPITDHPPK